MDSTMTSPLAAYAPYRSQLAEIKEANASLVFDYASKAGEKSARSHIAKLRKTKAAIERARVAAKADALEYGRRVDAEAKDLIGEVEGMIETHDRPLREITEREEQRVRAHRDGIEKIQRMKILPGSATVQVIADRLRDAGATTTGGFEEFRGEALLALSETVESLTGALVNRQKYDEDQTELARLRAENEARHRTEAQKAKEQQAEDQRLEALERIIEQEGYDVISVTNARNAAVEIAERVERDVMKMATAAVGAGPRLIDPFLPAVTPLTEGVTPAWYALPLSTRVDAAAAAKRALVDNGLPEKTATFVMAMIRGRMVPHVRFDPELPS